MQGCEAPVGSGTEPVSSDHEGISPSSACFTVAPTITFSSEGSAVSNDSYGTSACPNGYMIDLNTYAKGRVANVAWGGVLPTNQTTCEHAHIVAYVWRRESNGTGTFLGSKDIAGAWKPDIKGVSHCVPPSVVLEKVIPGFVANGTTSYRLGIGAHATDPTTGNWTLTRVAFATNNLARPFSQTLAVAAQLLQGSAQFPGVMNSFFNAKANYQGGVVCRGLKLEQELVGLSQQSLIRAGASSSNATSIASGLTRISTGLCTTAGTIQDLQAGTTTYINALVGARNDIQSRFAGAPDPLNLASEMVANTPFQVLSAIGANCGVTSNALVGYLYDGTLPSGTSADQLLFGTCKTRGSSAQAIAASLGLGSDFPNQTTAQARTAFQQCMTDSGGQDVCNDPRAADAPAAPDTAAPDQPPTCWITPENRPCNSTELAQFQSAQAEKDKLVTTSVTMGTNSVPPNTPAASLTDNPAVVLGIISGALYSSFKYVQSIVKVSEAMSAAEVTGAALPTSVVLEAANVYMVPLGVSLGVCAANPANCDRATRTAFCALPGAPFSCNSPSGSNQFCAPDFQAAGGWYQTTAQPGTSNEISKADRFEHCMCQMMSAAYAGVPNAAAKFVPLGCPSPEEKRREDCLRNPQGPTDAPNAACLQELSPSLEVNAWHARICNALQCDPTLQSKETDADGNCSCVKKPPIDTTASLPCSLPNVMLCDGDIIDPSHCTCQPPDAGKTPIGDNPLCAGGLTNATGWPGSTDSFLVKTAGDIITHQFNASTRLAMLRPNRSAVSPLLYRNSFAAVPATSTTNLAALRINTLLGARPSSGNVDLQVYVTSFGTPSGTQPLVHDFMGQVRLTGTGTSANLTPGVLTNVDIPLAQNLINRAFSGTSFRVEYTVVAPSGYIRRVGFGDQSFVGTTVATPVASRAPLCPINPAPDDPIKIITGFNPTWAINETVSNPLVNFTLSSGDLAAVPPRIVEYTQVIP
jgi:hypothetical protein